MISRTVQSICRPTPARKLRSAFFVDESVLLYLLLYLFQVLWHSQPRLSRQVSRVQEMVLQFAG
jgi:hypothetical protein